MTVVMGLDLSLRGAAAVVLPSRWSPTEPWSTAPAAMQETPAHERFTVEGRLEGEERSAAIVGSVLELVAKHEVTHVFVEEYAFSFRATSVTGLAELRGALKYALWKTETLRLVPIVASSARKILFGKTPRMARKEWKAAIRTALDRMGSPFEDGDTRDAFVVANAARFRLGLPAFATSAPG